MLFKFQSTDYANELMEKAMQLCSADGYKPQLHNTPSPLASQYEHPDKDTIPLFSHYNN